MIMKPEFEQKFKSAPGSSLSAAEREHMRKRLLRHMEHNPASAPARISSWQSSLAWSSYLGRAGAFAALLLLAGGGVSFAAENALPGDPLYAVKRAVNEPVQAALAVGTGAKASWSAEQAARRLAEAEQLASRGTLDAKTAQSLGADFEKSAQAAADQIAALKETRPDDAAVAAVKLSASLSAHESILGSLGDAGGASDVQATTIRVREDLAFAENGAAAGPAAAAKVAPAASFSRTDVSTGTDIEASSTNAGTTAAFRLAALQARADAAEKLNHAQNSLSAEALARAAKDLAQIDALLSRAEADLATSTDASQAADEYRRALGDAESLSVFLKAAAVLNRPALFGVDRPDASTTPTLAPSSDTQESGGRATDKKQDTVSGSGDTNASSSAATSSGSGGEGDVRSGGNASSGASRYFLSPLKFLHL